GDRATVQMVYELVDRKTSSIYKAIGELRTQVEVKIDEHEEKIDIIDKATTKNTTDIGTIYKGAGFIGGLAGLVVNAIIDFVKGGGGK
ncbi:MAG: hypothetical protein NUV97_00330, partial [archaeon]|nr:hypothetical protein [archaeon]